ncbi:MAG: MNIO family bufferin maturase [Methyloceanibacter sp.]|uniref:MNIO family bufferin maturase n=1 Tax=Methyloceanibacter sp. TaxID=1965321 RepID=UPI003D9BA491
MLVSNVSTTLLAKGPIPPRAGVGLKPEHYGDILKSGPDIGWFEIHAENYMGEGGPPHHYLRAVRELYPVSLHGVGLSIGGSGALDAEHLARLKQLVERYEPAAFSEHLAWSTHDTVYLNDLLPLPYTEETLQRVSDHIDEVQDGLGRQMLLENPSTYIAFAEAEMSEIQFLRAVVRRTGCGLLLDVNNVFVQATNHDFAPEAYIDAFPIEHVGEIHLGGHAEDDDDDGAPLLIDDHGNPVADPVWGLYARAIARSGPKPTLIEWDNDVPEWGELLAEAKRADAVMTDRRSNHVAA